MSFVVTIHNLRFPTADHLGVSEPFEAPPGCYDNPYQIHNIDSVAEETVQLAVVWLVKP